MIEKLSVPDKDALRIDRTKKPPEKAAFLILQVIFRIAAANRNSRVSHRAALGAIQALCART